MIEESNPELIYKPWSPYKWTTITLRSFVDNATGRDYVKEASDAVLELLNPENYNMGVSYWRIEDGILKLSINMFQSKTRYPYELIRFGGIIPVEVDLETGEIKID